MGLGMIWAWRKDGDNVLYKNAKMDVMNENDVLKQAVFAGFKTVATTRL